LRWPPAGGHSPNWGSLRRGEYTLQESGSPVMDNITWFHNFLLVLITVITLFVLALLVIVVIKFNAKSTGTLQDHPNT